jgi:hypothetical protein
LRAAKSRRRRVSGERREPTIRKPVPSPGRIERAQRQRAQDQVAERSLVADELAQPAGRDAHDGTRLAHDRAEEHRLAGQQPELTDAATVRARRTCSSSAPCPSTIAMLPAAIAKTSQLASPAP